MCSAIAVVATISPRCGWWAGAISSARWPNCAAVPGSVVSQRFRRVEQRADGHFVPDSRARRELSGDFDRQCARLEKDACRLPVQGAAGGHRHALTHRFASDVVPERQPLVPLDEEIRLQQLADRRQDVRCLPAKGARQFVEREGTAERGSHCGGIARFVRQPAQPLPHLLVDPPRKTAIDQLGAAVDHTDAVLLLKAEQSLDNQEWAALGLCQLIEDRSIGLGGEHVPCDLCHRVVRERTEGDMARTLLLQSFECVQER